MSLLHLTYPQFVESINPHRAEFHINLSFPKGSSDAWIAPELLVNGQPMTSRPAAWNDRTDWGQDFWLTYSGAIHSGNDFKRWLKLVEVHAQLFCVDGQALQLNGLDRFGWKTDPDEAIAFSPPEAFPLKIHFLNLVGATVRVRHCE